MARRKGISCETLAEAAGVNRETVQRLVRTLITMYRENPNLQTGF